MLKYDWSKPIARPPAEVFEYLVDTKKQALYSDVPMRQITPGRFANGSRIEVTFGMGALKAVIRPGDDRCRRGRANGLRHLLRPIQWKGAYTLRPSGAGTDLNCAGTMQFTGLWRPLDWLVAGELKSGGLKELERLKSVVEAAA